MDRFNRTFLKAVNIALIGLLFLIPTGMVYRLVEMYQIESAGYNSEWTSVILIVLLFVEIYLLLFLLWFKYIASRKMHAVLKLIQLIAIFLLGIIPGVLILYPAFIKS